jgi:glycosyltransferase involved in cell wall biosynthesis
MAMGRPTVTTTIGGEGLPLTHGDELLIADDPASFAAAVVTLLEDPVAADVMGRRASARVRRDFSWERVAREFADICQRVAERVSARTPATVGGRRAP